jgi:hypothetical protein
MRPDESLCVFTFPCVLGDSVVICLAWPQSILPLALSAIEKRGLRWLTKATHPWVDEHVDGFIVLALLFSLCPWGLCG